MIPEKQKLMKYLYESLWNIDERNWRSQKYIKTDFGFIDCKQYWQMLFYSKTSAGSMQYLSKS